ncbi:PREDICTED: uncharacterized protein LOC104820140 [Tarenaya hassleriana]|uniref:uncharacterized protein LOC104820140 n=1 Tax=Tarenaya hassleriana TaxID=28532 RepID=UPI00053C6558|nr:PREDICTED: uncharacterized protein LOC104820140 [Tarenaya hassleriana]
MLSLRQIFISKVAYRSHVFKFYIHVRCVKEPLVLQLHRPKCHDHTLTLIRRLTSFTRNACGLVDEWSPTYICLRCDFVVHKKCIYLPRVIRISRHQHRLSYASSFLPTEARFCGVCRKAIDNNFGPYSCNKGCRYTVHSKCATMDDVWDGKDLEGVAEEAEEDVTPFEVINDKVIRHFGHRHHLLNMVEHNKVDGHCQACCLPVRIHVGSFYSCTECDFILHERCANLDRKAWFMIHPHRLELKTTAKTYFECHVCGQTSCGFRYKCCETYCEFEIDVNCASVSEPYLHETHAHPLFCTMMSSVRRACLGCRGEDTYRKMECSECEYVLDFKCITLPPMVRYKHDRHPLILHGGEDTTCGYWCEICERKMDAERLFYACDDCCVTVHVECVLGLDPHMKPGLYPGMTIEANTSCSRPICHKCKRRCPYPILFKKKGLLYCSLYCRRGYTRRLPPFAA